MIVRRVTLTADEAQTVEDLGKELLGKGDSRGLTLLALYLQYREAGPVALDEFAFMCDVDESAGMAEVVQLHGYSKKAVCD